MWQLIQDNFISHYHEYIGYLHYVLVALRKIQTFAKLVNSPNIDTRDEADIARLILRGHLGRHKPEAGQDDPVLQLDGAGLAVCRY